MKFKLPKVSSIFVVIYPAIWGICLYLSDEIILPNLFTQYAMMSLIVATCIVFVYGVIKAFEDGKN